jgi:HAD superfamily, subfamily IIIB (Acid phosphatase)
MDAYAAHNQTIVPFKSGERKKFENQGYTIITNVGDQQSDLYGGSAESPGRGSVVMVPRSYAVSPRARGIRGEVECRGPSGYANTIDFPSWQPSLYADRLP